MEVTTRLPGDDFRVYSGCQRKQLPEKSWPCDSLAETCESSQKKLWDYNKINHFAQWFIEEVF